MFSTQLIEVSNVYRSNHHTIIHIGPNSGIQKTYDANALSHGVTGQVLGESSTHAPGVAVQASDLAPDRTDARLDEGLLRHRLAGLRLVDVRAALAHVEVAVRLLAASLNLLAKYIKRNTNMMICCMEFV